MSIQRQERTLEVWDGAETVKNARIHESVLCIAPNELTREELHLVAGDAHFLKSVDEVTDMAEAGYNSAVVYAAGLELARELMQINALDGTGRIHWHLGLDLLGTLETLIPLELPVGVRVENINHVATGTVVTTALTTGSLLDTESFRRGVQAESLRHFVTTAAEDATASDKGRMLQERLLQERLLHLLRTLGPLIDSAPACGRPHDSAAENQLILLKRKYDALERKYHSLASARLGKLTLRLWARKRGTRRSNAAPTRAR